MIIRRKLATLAAAAAMLASAGALAQQAANPPAKVPADSQQGGPGAWHQDHMLHMCRDMDARLAGQLAYAEARLGITDQQRPAWKKLADTLRGAQEPVRRVCADLGQQPPATTLPARLDRIQKMVEARAAALRTALPAIEQFYGTLTADQKKTADQMTMHGGHGMMGHM